MPTQTEHDLYITGLERRIAKLERAIARWDADTRDTSHEAQQRLADLRETVEQRRVAFREKLVHAKKTGSAAWTELRDGLESAWTELRDAFDRARLELLMRS